MNGYAGKNVIIGAGSTGSSIAYYMRSVNMDVTLVEMNGIGTGNTGKSSALVRTHYSNRTVADMAKYSLDLLKDFQKIGYSGFTKTGMIYAFQHSDEVPEKGNVEMLRDLGIGIEQVDPEDLEKIYPGINTENLDFIISEPESGYADPVATANSFASSARENGARIDVKKKATRIRKSGSRTIINFSDGTEMEADRVILATNIWTNKLLRDSGVEMEKLMPIIATRHNVIYMRRPEDFYGIKPVLWDMAQLAYYKMEGESVTALGSLDPQIDRIPVDPEVDIFDEVNDEYLQEYMGKIVKRLKKMENATLISAVSGRYDMTPDGEPIIDSLEDLGFGEVYICAGLSGHGFKLSPALGLIVREMIQDRPMRESRFDRSIFRKDRFEKGLMIGRTHEGIGTIY